MAFEVDEDCTRCFDALGALFCGIRTWRPGPGPRIPGTAQTHL